MSFRSSALSKNGDINFKEVEAKVKKAKSEKKIFLILGRYDAIRRCLLLRNWLEKVPDDQLVYITPATERLTIAMLLKPHPFHFTWQPRNRPIRCNDSIKPFINSIKRQNSLDFTAKDGLTNCASNFQWNFIENVTDLNYPRTFVLSDKQTKDEFAEEFRRTAFTSFISFLNTRINFDDFFSEKGDISTECIEFCIQKLELLLKINNHDDIDTSRVFDICAKFPRNQKKILLEMKQIISGTKKFNLNNDVTVDNLKSQVKICATKILEKWPYLKYDGHKNIWILKPIGWSSGSGVVLMNDEEKIKNVVSSSSISYVAQKYIERPMIIHDRKFDIRIYFMSFINKGVIYVWLYRDCYIKFATEPFNLNNFNKSIHVTNYAVQKHFMNDYKKVPYARENMWPLSEFIKYVATIDEPRLWEAKIYPAIKKNLLAVILASFEVTEMEPNNFELNGADFMVWVLIFKFFY
jgi:tubulin monoglycylase TTLL3/8